MNGKNLFPDVAEYDWVKELPSLRINSKFKEEYNNRLILGQTPPTPVGRVLAVLQEAFDKPAVWATWVKLSPKPSEKDKAINGLFWEYVKHKYGNRTWEVNIAAGHVWKIPSSYTRVDDPGLRQDILDDVWVCEDDEANNEPLFPEMAEYDWVKEYDEVSRKSKVKSQPQFRDGRDMPPAPVELVLTLMKEKCDRPEIWKAFVGLSSGNQLTERERLLISVFDRYLEHKYGNETKAIRRITKYLVQIAAGVYSGLRDPNLREDLLKTDFVYSE